VTAAPGGGPDGAGIALVVAGGVVAIGGAVMWGVGAADVASIEGATGPRDWSADAGAYERAPILTAVGPIALGAGVAAAAVGAVLLVTAGSGGESARVRVGPGSLSVEGRF
jgi:hypothetical protein